LDFTERNNNKEYMMLQGFKIIASSALILAIAACAAPPIKKEQVVFYPSPPDLPRVQYLTSFSGSRDVEAQTAFEKFVVGQNKDIKLDKPYGVAIYDGKIYVCDTNNTVIVFDFKGKKFRALPGAKGQGKLVEPLNISIEEDGTKYVTDPVRGQVVVFDRDDLYVRTYGMPGNWKPIDAVVFGEYVYVSDMDNGRVDVFDKKTGETVKTIGDKGEISQRLSRPTDLAFDKEGNLYVTDFARFQIVKFDRDGHFLSTIGRLGDALANFVRPKGIALDNESRLFAVDAAFNNVQVFNKAGALLMFVGGGTPQEAGSLVLPAQIVIDYKNLKYFQQYVDPSFEADYLIIVTSQFGDHRVNLYAFGKEKGKKYPTDEELNKTLQEKIKKELEKLKPAENKEGRGQGETEEKAGNPAKPADAPAVK